MIEPAYIMSAWVPGGRERAFLYTSKAPYQIPITADVLERLIARGALRLDAARAYDAKGDRFYFNPHARDHT